MQYVHRDNFRRLTGHGRDLANSLDRMLSRAAAEFNGRFDGDVFIHREPDGDILDVRFNQHPDECIHDGKPLHSMLTILMVQNDRAEIVAVPLMAVLSDGPDLSNSYALYQHSFNGDENARYIGITKQGWRKRWQQHVSSANSGSHYRFHRAIRQWQRDIRPKCSVTHIVLSWGMTEREALEMEEEYVRETLYPRGLNMVPGGNAGLAYLRKIGAIGQVERLLPDERHSVINRFFERTSRKGTPNPLAAANWLSPDYAEKVICAGPDRLKPQQIRDARFLSSLGQDASRIADGIGARNVAQVQRLLAGYTYSRVL